MSAMTTAIGLPRSPAHEAPSERAEEQAPRELLLHYVAEGPRTIDSVDQLGNFLMGFGALALGYMLQVELRLPLEALRSGAPGRVAMAALALAAWGAAVLLLVGFVHSYVTRVLAGRSVHAEGGNEEKIGQVLELPAPDELSWRKFIASQPTWKEFLRGHYRPEDRRSAEQLLYARWTYLRFMCVAKLAEMARMRRLLAQALGAGVLFKLATVALAA